jgi:hypothetical protein
VGFWLVPGISPCCDEDGLLHLNVWLPAWHMVRLQKNNIPSPVHVIEHRVLGRTRPLPPRLNVPPALMLPGPPIQSRSPPCPALRYPPSTSAIVVTVLTGVGYFRDRVVPRSNLNRSRPV